MMGDAQVPARRRRAARSQRIHIKRAYVEPAPGDGRRVLVDRIWPRGVSRSALALDAWLKDAAPSDALRRWFNHDRARWPQFVARYRRELDKPPASEALAELIRRAQQGTLTLIYAAHDETHNNAVVLSAVIAKQLTRDEASNL